MDAAHESGRRISRRDMLRLVAISGAGLVAAACTPATAQPTAAPTAGPLATATPPPAQPTTVTFWVDEGVPIRYTAWKELTEKFHAANPLITIDEVDLPLEEAQSKMVAGLETGVLPDAVYSIAEPTVFVEQGALLELTPFFNDWAEKDLIEPTYIEVQRKTMPDGGLYAIPMRVSLGVLYYRQKWFEEASLEAPKTNADMRHAAEILNDPAKGRAGYIFRGGAGNLGIAQGYGQLFSLLPLYNDDGTSNWADPGWLEGIQFWLDYFNDGLTQSTAPTDAFTEMTAIFQGDGGAMLEHNTGSMGGHLEKLGADNFRTTSPVLGPKGKRVHGEIAGVGGSIFKAAKDVDATWKWYSYTVSVEGAGYHSQRIGVPPANKGIYEEPWFKDHPFFPPIISGLFDGNTQWAASPPNPLLVSYLGDVAAPGLQNVILGEKDLTEWAQELSDMATSTMQEYMQEKGIERLNG